MCAKERTVLLIEPDPDHELLITHSLGLARGGLRINNVPSAELAIWYLSGDPPFDDREEYPIPSLIISEFELPGISGLELLEWIQNRDEFCSAPVFVLTLADEPEYARRAFQLGAIAFETKPCDFSELVPIVEELLERYGSWASRSPPS